MRADFVQEAADLLKERSRMEKVMKEMEATPDMVCSVTVRGEAFSIPSSIVIPAVKAALEAREHRLRVLGVAL